MMRKVIYQYTNDSWVDGDEECPCCSGLVFEAYNAWGWDQNGTATSLWNLYVDVIVAHKASENGSDYNEIAEFAYELYEGFTLQELMNLCDRLEIVLEEV